MGTMTLIVCFSYIYVEPNTNPAELLFNICTTTFELN